MASNAHFLVLAKPHATNPAALVVPFRHIVGPFDFTPDEWLFFGAALSEAKLHLSQFEPDGLTVGWNVGDAAGQHILHAHLPV